MVVRALRQYLRELAFIVPIALHALTSWYKPTVLLIGNTVCVGSCTNHLHLQIAKNTNLACRDRHGEIAISPFVRASP